MNRSSIRIHLGLLALTLLGAWLTFRGQLGGDARSDEGGVVLLQATEGDVERLVYQEEGRTLRLEARQDETGRWFEGVETVAAGSSETPSGPAGDDGTDDDEPTETAAEDARGEAAAERTEVFRGGHAVETLWQQLEPLEVSRVLGTLDEAKLAELELAEPTTSLTVTVRGREHRFALGGELFGSSDRYARDEDGRVVVLPGALVRELEAGRPRLMERRLTAAARPEVESLEMSRHGESLVIVQHDGSEAADAYWTRAGEEEPSGELQAWADKFFRLQTWGYREGEPAPTWRSEATIVVVSGEQGSETVRIWSVEEEGERRWLARSDHSRLVAELGSLAEEVCQDLDGLLP